jgi:hypothetical protein
VSIFTNIYHFWLIFHEILLQFQENYSNFGQILLIFVKFHEILLQFQENYSDLRSNCVKVDTFFIDLGQISRKLLQFRSNFTNICQIS